MNFLDGYTVLDLASVGPAARASRLLADFGMRVIKVAPVAAKGAKQVDPVFHAYGAGRGTRRMRVDLKSDAGRDTLLQLAGHVDVVIESYRPGVAARLGVGYADFAAYNPKIVYCSTSGYGQHGPCAQWVGHDLNYLAMSGFLACSGRDAEGRPALPGATLADGAGGGMHAAQSILAALLRRERTGKGASLDVAITDGALNLMSLYLDQYLATGEDTGPGSGVLTGKYAWYGVYATGDGGHLAVGAIEGHFFRNLCRLLELESFADHQYDETQQDAMRAAFAARFLTRSRDEWVALLAGADTCVAPVLTVPEVVAHPQFRTRDAFMGAEHPGRGAFEQLAPVLAGCERRQPVHHVAPPGHTDTDAILAEAGFPASQIAELRTTGAIE
ncbi:CaiB/BaiF CoA-transferase family protein [Azoarcus sp. DN11]|uniref:CaiB/BaiF CoA transferase family protein n=1 Tax=Azoarcus sp. DN11 TaxID=356837 RepID=UPI000EB08CE4|nr:CaiB/BaiF CoA-transferase family protein [Azoarcus sp. DN11]AYH43734.1 carnitine dehydratase [Azoarcus sp. DN11]